MDNQKKLGNWILCHTHSLDLKIERMNWIQNWFPEHKDFKISFSTSNEVLVGRGIDTDEDTALIKAFSELVERSVCSFYGINSNGVAAHFDKGSAVLNAKKELIERDAILCHHLTGKPFFINEKPVRFDSLKFALFGFGMDLTFGEAISSVDGFHVVVCRISGRDRFGTFWGFGCDTDLNKAFDHASFECMINVSAYIYGKYGASPSSRELKKGLDHQRFYFSENVSELKTVRDFKVPSPILKMDEIECVELGADFSPWVTAPIFIMQANSSLLQTMFYGEADETKINLKRLSLFTGENLKEFSRIPHPIG